ncbi:MAG: pyruvate kinase [candidate division WOR-3 bacterium]
MPHWQVKQWVDPASHRTPIVATVGPAVYDPAKGIDMLDELVGDGVAVFRMNFSHVTPFGELNESGATEKYSYEQIRGLIRRIRTIEKARSVPIPVMMDLKGPEIRVQHLFVDGHPTDRISVAENEPVLLTQSCRRPGKGKLVVVTFEGDFSHETRRGNLIRIDDGRVSLRILRTGEVVTARAETGGVIKLFKSVNLPDHHLTTVSSITDKDRDDLAQCFDVDLIAQSFVRSAADVAELGRLLRRLYSSRRHNPEGLPTPKIIAKIETAEAVSRQGDHDTFLEILEEESTFGVMVARGDLGGELGLARVPAVQERLLNFANRVGKPAIVATQMLETMIDNPVPVRAEMEDIWSAIREGADAVMLSGETAKGRFPRRAVRQMSEVIDQTRLDTKLYRLRFEDDFVYGGTRPAGTPPEKAVDVVGYAITTIAEGAMSPFIITYATKGWSATRIARFRPRYPIRIIALPTTPQTARILRLLHAVCPVLLTSRDRTSSDLPRERTAVIELSRYIIRTLLRRSRVFARWLEPGWQSRFIVATLADRRPEHDWDKARDLIVFRYCR